MASTNLLASWQRRLPAFRQTIVMNLRVEVPLPNVHEPPHARVHPLRAVLASIGSALSRAQPALRFVRDGRGSMVYLLRAMFFVNVGPSAFGPLPVPSAGAGLALRRGVAGVRIPGGWV